MLDDNGDGVGKEAGAPGPDGAVAVRTYVAAPDPNARETDPELGELMRRRAALEEQVAQLKKRKPLMPPADYAAELERLLIELARLSRTIRSRS